MKRITLSLIALLSMTLTVRAQQYVSTEPANRNVILEEFTGRTCPNCPDGHKVANQIMANNPGRVWAINVHAGGYAPNTYPNFKTTDGNVIHGGFTIGGYPTGVVNRSTPDGQSRGVWTSLSNTQLNQASECNVAGVVAINPDTRVASITVEVYYTGNSGYDENYLTVAMLQDSILGSQSGMSYNPSQIIGNQYCHMHVLRDIINESAWGDVISPTTQGTLITKTYEYTIPESIGSPNGVEVVLEHIFFLAWVSERYQGTPTRPILTACELETTYMTNEPIYPSIPDVTQVMNASCGHLKTFEFTLANIGVETFNSVKFNAKVENMTHEFEWNGKLGSGEKTNVEFSMEIPFGSNIGELNITEVNGAVYEKTKSFTAECSEWQELETQNDMTSLKVYIIQDMYGEQTTWSIVNSAGDAIASGGPYDHLMNGATQVNVANVTDVPANDCYLFRIFDSAGNGICCNYGEGFYYIKDANGNKFIEGDGSFGSMAAHLFSINKGDGIGENVSGSLDIYPNPASDKIFVEGENVSIVEIYNSLGQKLSAVEGSADKTSVDVASFENGVYIVRVLTKEGNVMIKKVSIVR